jgi:5-methylcytosine-specific restriction endonuclease McrA
MEAPVLVLNANFEPVNVCDMRRAIGLILAEKAALVINGRGEIQTVNASFPRPSVIRLQKMIHRPRAQLKLTRREVFRRDNYTCQYCGKKTSDLTIDHVIPRHLGGKHVWNNVVAACPVCNHRKGGRLPEETNMNLLRQPAEPPSSAQYIFGRHLAENGEWEMFLTGW